MTASRGRTIALLGHPVAHSLSPHFQQAALDAAGVDARYEAWDTLPASLPQAVERLRSAGLLGANITVPHKVEALRLIDRPDALAELVGAVNTITNRDGLLYGTNTDVHGVLQSLEDGGVEIAGRTVLLIGAGGAARAVVVAMRQGRAGALTIANRTEARAHDVASAAGDELPVAVCPLDPSTTPFQEAMARSELVIHSTSLGMRNGPDEQATAVPAELFRAGQTAFDLVYTPERTPFLQAAERAGARTIGGLSMLVHQGAESFRLWTGEQPPLDVMFEAARTASTGT
ncbi:MAG: shikimate dehydrogenase [Dehalococcoidia bacterium]|jgi:shikimate dehydrogenase|nr:shikimate dehydrogenase [Dehalococcoidia bacterium]